MESKKSAQDQAALTRPSLPSQILQLFEIWQRFLKSCLPISGLLSSCSTASRIDPNPSDHGERFHGGVKDLRNLQPDPVARSAGQR